jgi:hypothetical protein
MNRKSNGVLIQLGVAAVIVGALCVACVAYLAGTSDTRAGRTTPARTATPAPSREGQVKQDVRKWMAENFADPHFEEVRWWVSKDGTAAVLRVRFKGPLGGPLIQDLGLSRSVKDGSVGRNIQIEARAEYNDPQVVVDSNRQYEAKEAAEAAEALKSFQQREAATRAENQQSQ